MRISDWSSDVCSSDLGAGGELDGNGKPVALQVLAGEKVYQDFTLALSDDGGHSSRPKKDNPITRLSAALVRLGSYQFPIAVNAATRGYFTTQAKQVAPDRKSTRLNSSH